MRQKLAAIAFAALCLSTITAAADAIDGHWCSPEGRHIHIAGPAITTSSGLQMQGNYTRHTFAYVAPAAEPEAGNTVSLQLAGETRVYVQIVGAAAAPQLWRRCEDVS